MTSLQVGVPKVISVGEVLFDYLADQVDLSFQQVSSWTPYPGGAPANVACALAKLGTPAAFMGCVGRDSDGEALGELLRSQQVNLEGLQYHPQAPTRSVYVTRNGAGDRTFAGFGGADTTTFADAYLDAGVLPEALFEQAQFLAIGTLGLAYPHSRGALHRSLELAHGNQVRCLVDLNWRPVFWPQPEKAHPLIDAVLAQAHFIKLSDEEAQLFFDGTDPQRIAARYPQLQGVLVTAGEKGCRYWFEGVTGDVPAFDVEVVDTTGAGDAFVSGFLHQLCTEPDLDLHSPEVAQGVVRYASAVGALTTTQAGAIAAQPSAAKVNAFLA